MLIGDGSHVAFAREFLHHVDVFAQGSHTLFVESHAVHAQGIEVTHLLLNAAARVVGSQVGDDVLDLVAAVLGQLVEGAETRILRVERIGLHPTAACVLIEVLARMRTRIEIAAVNGFHQVAGSRCHCNECHEKNRNFSHINSIMVDKWFHA